MAFLYYYDDQGKMSVITLFGPGEIAIVPDVVKTSIDSATFLVVCKHAHLIEICIRNIDQRRKLYPDMTCFTRRILAYQSNKQLQKDKLLGCKGPGKLAMFIRLFPQIDLFGAGTKMNKKYIAAFMCIEAQSFSRNLKLYKEMLGKKT